VTGKAGTVLDCTLFSFNLHWKIDFTYVKSSHQCDSVRKESRAVTVRHTACAVSVKVWEIGLPIRFRFCRHCGESQNLLA